MSRLLFLSCLAVALAFGQAAPEGEPAPAVDEDSTLASNDTERHPAYGRYRMIPVLKNWYQAFALCMSQSKRLATFEDDVEFGQIVTLIMNNNRDKTHINYWLGGSDQGEKSNYVWMSTGDSLNHLPWHDNEPNHLRTPQGDVEHCVEVRPNFNYKMNDENCYTKNYVICESIPSN